ncbi:RBBP9/YdeN family alpha/beta hydrolase [Nocardia cyriacigeorgica]|uniref:RBBP9/YdeN family alpha/beta hydrolase n=1 Tax=Nocardia cyriacigeorgica TaxID=135487 RepID=UPI0024559B4A|nr:alpha/beta hydrolase [Nocardia cyriacigeorgica]
MTELRDIPVVPALRRAVIVHGYGATPDDHWFGWLAHALGSSGIAAEVPMLPEADAPDRTRWASVIERTVGTPDAATAIVAHSLGALTVLRHLAGLPHPWSLRRLVLVSGFLEPLPVLPELDEFIEGGCAVEGVRSSIGAVTVIRSDDDEIVPTAHTDRLAARLGVESVVVPGAGHFLADDGVTALEAARVAVLG